VALFIDTVQTGLAVREDHKMGTTRNTVETVAGIGGGWLGGYGGIIFFYTYKTCMLILNYLTYS
jgi:tetrahydromethanopterin S-methyltransferase subunit D